jgi:CheY-like chemotaxis protein
MGKQADKKENLFNQLSLLISSGKLRNRKSFDFHEESIIFEKNILICFAGILFFLTIARFIIFFWDIPGYKTFPVFLFIIMYTLILLVLPILIISTSRIKKRRTLFIIKLLLLIIVYIMFSSRIIHMIVTSSYDTSFTVKVYFMFFAVYFFSGSLFDFSLIRVTIVNFIMITTMALFYSFSLRKDKVGEIIFLSTMILCIEISSYLWKQLRRKLENKYYHFEFYANYFFEILDEMKTGIIIIKDGQLIFENKQFEKNYENITKENKEISQISKFLEWMENNLQKENELIVKDNQIEKIEKIDDNIKTTEHDLILNICKNKSLHKNNWKYLKSHAKVNFVKLGNLKTLSKIYEVFSSNHYLSLYKIKELMISDVTDSLKKERLTENFIFQSNLTAKISHEFITSLICVNHVVKTLKNKAEKEIKFLMQNRDYMVDNFKKIQNLNKFLLILVKELTFIIEHSVEEKNINLENPTNLTQDILEQFSNFDLFHQVEKLKKILNEVRNLSEAPLLTIIYSIELSDGRKIEINSDQVKNFNLIIFNDKKLIACFLCNIFYLASKLNNQANIEITIYLKEEEVFENQNLPIQENSTFPQGNPNPERKLNITVECKCNSGILDELFIPIKNVTMSDYTRKQSIDFAYKVITAISDYLNLKFELNRTLPEMFISKFDVKLKKFVEKKDMIIIYNSDEEEITKKVPSSELRMDFNRENLNFNEKEKEENLSEINIISPPSPDSRSIKFKNKKWMSDNKIINSIKLDIPMKAQMENKKIIIIADDIQEIRKSLMNILDYILGRKYPRGYFHYLECSDGAEILNEIYKLYNKGRIGSITCLITDQLMNLINGTHVTKIINHLVEENKIPKFPVIFSTAQNDKLSLLFIKELIPIKVMYKPVSKNILASTFEELGIL